MQHRHIYAYPRRSSRRTRNLLRQIEPVRRVHRDQTPIWSATIKARGLWEPGPNGNDLKVLNDGSVQYIDRVPADLKRCYATAFEVEPKLDRRSPPARRQKWIDQAQSINLYIAGASGKAP